MEELKVVTPEIAQWLYVHNYFKDDPQVLGKFKQGIGNELLALVRFPQKRIDFTDDIVSYPVTYIDIWRWLEKEKHFKIGVTEQGAYIVDYANYDCLYESHDNTDFETSIINAVTYLFNHNSLK